MIFRRLRSGDLVKDDEFDALYPLWLRGLVAETYFTPVAVAKVAAQFLAPTPGARVLDIGSGTGKFCMVGVSCTAGVFTGIELRESLCNYSQSLVMAHNLANIKFINANIIEIDFQQFDAFYFFNSFYENLYPKLALDNSIFLSKSLYTQYSRYVFAQLSSLPRGTKLATYFSFADEIPNTYKLVSTAFGRKLKLWEKTN